MNNEIQQLLKVSVGVPVYNGERYLEEVLGTIQSQTLNDIEIIVSDNASTDRTAEIVLDLAVSDKRIHFFRQSANRGAAANYNFVFQKSRAKYFSWAAADDLMAPTFLASCIGILEKEPNVCLVYPQTELIDSEGLHLSFYNDNLNLRQTNSTKRACSFINRINLCNPVFGVHRRTTLLQTNLIQRFPGSDAVLLFEIALQGQICEYGEPLFKRRVHKNASKEANPTASSIQAWFDPSKRITRWTLPVRIRLLVEYLRVVQNHPTSRANRLLTAVAVFGVWCLRRTRVMVGRWRRMLGFAGGVKVARNERFPMLR